MLYDPKWDDKSPNAILLKAADLLRQHGLAKYTQRELSGSMCIHGAISVATTGEIYDNSTPLAEAAWEKVAAHLNIHHDDKNQRAYALADWNNAPERTVEQVIGALEAAVHAL